MARIHFIGIGGSSMSSLAELLAFRGVKVSGSDLDATRVTERLASLGVSIVIGHDSNTVIGASLVVYSHAISLRNPEMLTAKNLGIPRISRATLLGALMLSYKRRIGISGTHGKSTTVAMLDSISEKAGCDPTTASGAALSCGSNLRIGGNSLFIYEACEYKDSFLEFYPSIAVALNLEHDHPDYFEDVASLRESFYGALSRAELAIINSDDEGLSPLVPYLGNRAVTFGKDDADFCYEINSFSQHGYDFTIKRQGFAPLSLSLGIIGTHNVTNAVAAAVAALSLGIDDCSIRNALSEFRGIERRLESVGFFRGREVFYDYAHHPTEIKASVDSVRMKCGGAVTVIFRPHTYSRTKALFNGFVKSLSLADHVILTDIYAAREEPIKGISSSALSDALSTDSVCLRGGDLIRHLELKTEGAIIIMGAGDLAEVKSAILSRG